MTSARALYNTRRTEGQTRCPSRLTGPAGCSTRRTDLLSPRAPGAPNCRNCDGTQSPMRTPRYTLHRVPHFSQERPGPYDHPGGARERGRREENDDGDVKFGAKFSQRARISSRLLENARNAPARLSSININYRLFIIITVTVLFIGFDLRMRRP